MFASPIGRANYTTRRVVVVGMLVFAFLVGALLAASPSDGARLPRSHVVRQGETLWGIASSSYGGDPRPHVDAIIHRNGLDDATIEPGETLVLP
jgi:nucleoid-associated protein YgaU